MARQKGIIKLQGTLGDITFMQTKDGYIAREKTSVSASRIATDPSYQRTRENNSEFGRAGKASKLLRTAFRTQLQSAKDSRLTSRLTASMMKVLKADVTSIRGMRNVIDGEAEFLKNFEFNNNAKLSSTLFAQYTTVIDRVSGVTSIDIPIFIPLNSVIAPEGSTHFKIVSAASAIDFEAETFITAESSSALLPWNATATAALSLSNTLPANSTHPLFLLAGIQFYQVVNTVAYPLKNGAFNALSIVKVDGV
jgi:hypothetical protein